VSLLRRRGVVYRLTGDVVCGILRRYDEGDPEQAEVDEVYPIAGSYATSTGKGLEPKYKRLEDIPDSDMKGLRIELGGGTYNKQKQRAIIDMQCDPERTGNEKSPVSKGKDDPDEKLRSAEADEKDDEDDDDNSLSFVSYLEDEDKKFKTLRLDWRTKYACESFEEDDQDGSGSDSSGKHWGFFTWFIVL
jgi:autophagy-related protein 27